MSERNCAVFDFDEWMALARSDPEAFEERRRQAIEGLMDQAPEACRQRLRCTQWRVERVRAECSNPLSACLKMQNLMWDSLYAEHGLLWALETLVEALPGHQAEPLHSAEVLPFKTPQRARR